jgi:hypothetical protein
LAILHEQAHRAGYVNGSEADRLRFFAAAEHARGVGTRNPAGLFAATVRQQRWSFLTLADEDLARRKLASIPIRESTGLQLRGSATPMLVGDLVSGLMRNLKKRSGVGFRR